MNLASAADIGDNLLCAILTAIAGLTIVGYAWAVNRRKR